MHHRGFFNLPSAITSTGSSTLGIRRVAAAAALITSLLAASAASVQRTAAIEAWAWDVAGNHSATTFPVTDHRHERAFYRPVPAYHRR
jgi:hypothetical protein